MNKIIYRVIQGVISNSGHGNYWLVNEFTNLRVAKYKFNEVKKDLRGINLYHNLLYLETIIEKYKWDEENEEYKIIDFVDDYIYRG